MCSVGWRWLECGGYELCFNRDEQWSRPLSTDPRRVTGAVIDGLCATDPQGGGTWLMVNAAGLTLAVMNHYGGEAGKVKTGRLSRGRLPLFAGLARSETELVPLLEMLDWSDYAPCRVLLVAPGGCARAWLWDGAQPLAEEGLRRTFLTTSSVQAEKIIAAREARADELAAVSLADLFDDVSAENPAAGVFMARADAGTVSQTRVRVESDRVTLAVRRRGEEFIGISCERLR